MISLSRFVEVQKWKICPVQFFSDFKDTVQSDGIRQWPYLPALAPSVSPHAVPTFQIRKLKQRGCDRFLEITHLKGVQLRFQSHHQCWGVTPEHPVQLTPVWFSSVPSPVQGTGSKMRFSTAFSSPPVCSTSSLTHS